MFDKIKAIMDMKKKMEEIKLELDKTEFEVSSSDGLIKITMNGSQQVQKVTIAGDPKDFSYGKLQDAIKDSLNRAIKRSQEIAAQKMKDAAGINLPGM